MDEFLRQRGVPTATLDVLQREKIDAPCIAIMTDDQLSTYIPQYGDRLALRAFLNREKKGAKPEKAGNKRKQSLFHRLRKQLKRKTESDSSEDEGQAVSLQFGNRNATKTSRRIGIGLSKFDVKRNEYKQVRAISGGGVREIVMSKTSTRNEILHEAKSLFFPKGYSDKFGAEQEYDFDVIDYKLVSMPSDVTIQQVFDMSKLSKVKFYLGMKQKENTDGKVEGSAQQTSQETLLKTSSVTSPTTPTTDEQDDEDLPMPPFNTSRTKPVSPTSAATVVSATLMDPENIDELDTIDDQDISPSGDGTAQALLSFDATYQDMFLPDIPDTADNLHSINTLIEEMDRQHPTIEHKIRVHRGHVFQELKKTFKENTYDLNKDLFTFEMILPNGKSEIAEDSGGVVRDALVEFWSSFYDNCCLGREMKVPFIRHDFSDSDWKAIASVLYLGWKTQRYFPIHLSKAFMSCCLFGVDIFSDTKNHLVTEYLSYLPLSQADTLKTAMEGNVDDQIQEDIIDIISTHDGRVIPTPENLTKIIGEIAHKELIQEPMYVKACWFEQLTSLGFELGDTSLESLYNNLIPNVRKVVKLFSFPESMSVCQTATSKFLITFVKELESDMLAKLLRFCTGSDLLLVDASGKQKSLTVRFNTLKGLERRPIAHTCGYVLELPEQYDSYLQFRSEFTAVLKSDIWIMDFV